MTAVSDKTFDVIIAGAGPAGSATAIRLAAAGRRVLLVEQKKFPRAKLCGEFISPECIAHFADLGVLDEMSIARGVELRETVFYSRSGKGVSVRSEWLGKTGSLALGLSRAEMDERLLRRAQAVGVEVLEETTASGLIEESGHVTGIRIRQKDGIETPIWAAVTIDATGRTKSLAKRIDKTTELRKRAHHVAFKAHLRGATTAADSCEIFSYRDGYGGCNRVENGLYNLCFIASSEDARKCGSDAERVMREVIFTNKRAAETLKNARVVSPWLAVPIERFGRGELVPAPGLLTVGDAAVFVDPFTGSGILLAIESAKIAAETINDWFKENAAFDQLATKYQHKYAAVFDTRLRVCAALRHVAFVPFLADATISILDLSRGLRRRIARATRFNPRRA